MSKNSINPIFADISALVEYCTSYYEEHDYATDVIDQYNEAGGKLVASETALITLQKGMTNRERLWDHLLGKATEYIKSEELSATDFRSDVLDYTALDQQLDFDLSEEYTPDIEELRAVLENKGLSEFRSVVNGARIQNKSLRIELEQMEIEDYSRGSSRGSWIQKSALSQYTRSGTQTESIMDFGFWYRQHSGAFVIGSLSLAAENKDDLADVIKDVANDMPTVLTPNEIYQKIPAF